jgi:hypothetical protein
VQRDEPALLLFASAVRVLSQFLLHSRVQQRVQQKFDRAKRLYTGFAI